MYITASYGRAPDYKSWWNEWSPGGSPRISLNYTWFSYLWGSGRTRHMRWCETIEIPSISLWKTGYRPEQRKTISQTRAAWNLKLFQPHENIFSRLIPFLNLAIRIFSWTKWLVSREPESIYNHYFVAFLPTQLKVNAIRDRFEPLKSSIDLLLLLKRRVLTSPGRNFMPETLILVKLGTPYLRRHCKSSSKNGGGIMGNNKG